MGVDYKNRLKELTPYPADDPYREIFTTSQREWVIERDKCEANIDCIRQTYLERLDVPDLQSATAKANRIQSLEEDYYLKDFVKSKNYEIAYVSRFDQPRQLFLQGNFAHNNEQELRVYIEDALKQVFKSDEMGFAFEFLEYDPYSENLSAIEESLFLREDIQYEFAFDDRSQLQLQKLSNIGVRNPGLGDQNALILNFETKAQSGWVSYIAVDCNIPTLPRLFVLDEEKALSEPWPEESDFGRFPDSDIDMSQESYNEFERMQLYQMAISGLYNEEGESVEIFELLEGYDVPYAQKSKQCAQEIKAALDS